MKKIFKSFKFWLIASAVVVLFAVNIVFSSIYRGEQGANIFTTISGWISGAATVCLGLIAVWQNRKYKKANDILMEEQKAILESEKNILADQKDISTEQEKLLKKQGTLIENQANLLKDQGELLKFLTDNQQNLLTRNLIYQFFNTFLNAILQQKDRLLDCSFEKIHNDLRNLPCVNESYNKILYQCALLIENLNCLIKFIKNSKCYFANTEELCAKSSEYVDSLIKYMNFIKSKDNTKYEKIYSLFQSRDFAHDQKILYDNFKPVVDNAESCSKSFYDAFDNYINSIISNMSDICHE